MNGAQIAMLIGAAILLAIAATLLLGDATPPERPHTADWRAGYAQGYDDACTILRVEDDPGAAVPDYMGGPNGIVADNARRNHEHPASYLTHDPVTNRVRPMTDVEIAELRARAYDPASWKHTDELRGDLPPTTSANTATIDDAP